MARLKIGQRVRVTWGSGIFSEKQGVIVSRNAIGHWREIPGMYKEPLPTEKLLLMDSGEYIFMFPERLVPV